MWNWMESDEIDGFRISLLKWYGKHRRPFPWRRNPTPYRVWISEIMLQQTQAKSALPYFNRFLKRFPSIESLADATEEEILVHWSGLGYYSRARNLHKAARRIIQLHDGVFPADYKTVLSLPGIGRYSAGAICSIAFNQRQPVVDGNIRRVIARLRGSRSRIPEKYFWDRMAEWVPEKQASSFNQAMMELGALICKPRNPLCDVCPLTRICRAYQTQQVADFPKRQKLKTIPQYHIAVGVVFRNERVLITRRKAEGLLGGLWEFPGGKIKDGESAQAACLREIKEEVNLDVQIDRHLVQVKHAYTHFRIVMEVFCCKYVSGRVYLRGPMAFRWIRLNEYKNYPFPKANHKFIPLLIRSA